MQPVAYLVKEVLPNYLSNLPIPDTFGGWFKLGPRDLVSLIPPAAAIAGLTYMSYRAFCPLANNTCSKKPAPNVVNPGILKTNNKVVDSIDVEDIADKAVFCRCWRSKNWPYCDGSHNAHNTNQKDNVGPLIVSKKQ